MKLRNGGLLLVVLGIAGCLGLVLADRLGSDQGRVARANVASPTETGSGAGRPLAATGGALNRAEPAEEVRTEVETPAPAPEASVGEDGSFEADAVFGSVVGPDGPIEGAIVLLFPSEVENDELTDPLADEFVTGRTGRFRFRRHDPDRPYRVHVQAEGFLPESETRYCGHDEEIELEPGVTIEGRVLNAETRAPLEGVSLSNRREHWNGKGFVPGHEASTDVDGVYRLSSMGTEGLQAVYVYREGYARETRKFQVDEGRLTGYDIELGTGPDLILELYDLESGAPVADTDVELRRGETERTDAAGRVRLIAAGESFKETVHLSLAVRGWCRTNIRIDPLGSEERIVRVPILRGARIEGRVTAGEKRGIADARVQVYGRFRGSDGPALPPNTWLADAKNRVRTDEDGKYVIEGIVPRKQALRIFADHFEYARTAAEELYLPSSGTTANVDLVLVEGSEIFGVVSIDGETASTNVAWSMNDNGEHFSGRTRSNDRGQYRLRGVHPGRIRLTAELDEQVWRGREEKPEEIWVKDDEVVEHDIVLASNVLPITGTVRDAGGEGLADVSVYAWAELGDGDGFHIAGTTEADGSFELAVDAIPGAMFQIGANDGPRSQWLEGVAAGTQGVEIVLPELGKLGLVVLDGVTDDAIQSFNVYWRTKPEDGFRRLNQGGRELSPGPDGVFLADLPLGPIDIRIGARSQGYVPVELPGLNVEPEGSHRTVEARLSRGVEIRLTFVPSDPALDWGALGSRIQFLTEEQALERRKGGDYVWSELLRHQTLRPRSGSVSSLKSIAPGTYRLLSNRPVVFDPPTIEVPPVDTYEVEVSWRPEKPNEKGQ